MNRAARRAQARCKHTWQTKEFPEHDYRHCTKCGREEWRGRLVPKEDEREPRV